MHWVKWCGILLVLGCGVVGGWQLSAFERARAQQAAGFLSLLRHIRVQIACYGTPCEQILARADSSLRHACRFPLQKGGLAMLLASTPLLVPREIATLLLQFAAELGSSYREEQLRCCDYYLTQLTPLCERVRTELPRRIRMAWLLPIALGASLLLMLI